MIEHSAGDDNQEATQFPNKRFQSRRRPWLPPISCEPQEQHLVANDVHCTEIDHQTAQFGLNSPLHVQGRLQHGKCVLKWLCHFTHHEIQSGMDRTIIRTRPNLQERKVSQRDVSVISLIMISTAFVHHDSHLELMTAS